MAVEIHISPKHLTAEFLTTLRSVFKGKYEVRVLVDGEQDETEYLMSSEANHAELIARMADAREGKNLVKVDIDML